MMNLLHYNSSQWQRTFSIRTVDVDIHFIVDRDLDGKIKVNGPVYEVSEISEQNREDNHIILMLLIQSLLILS